MTPDEIAIAETQILEFRRRHRARDCNVPGLPADYEATVAKAYYAQMRKLRLKPPRRPPCLHHYAVWPHGLDDEMLALAREMDQAGVDHLAHDPRKAIAEALARRAAYSAQITSLRLRPWQSPPCSPGRDPNARQLLDRMLAAGVDPLAHDPMAALAEAEGKPKRRRATRPERKP